MLEWNEGRKNVSPASIFLQACYSMSYERILVNFCTVVCGTEKSKNEFVRVKIRWLIFPVCWISYLWWFALSEYTSSYTEQTPNFHTFIALTSINRVSFTGHAGNTLAIAPWTRRQIHSAFDVKMKLKVTMSPCSFSTLKLTRFHEVV